MEDQRKKLENEKKKKKREKKKLTDLALAP